MIIYKPEKERKIDKRLKLRQELKELININYKNKLRIEEIKKELDETPESLEITTHAIERYKERIENIPTKIVKKILTDPDLLRKYKEHGEGKYKLKNYPNVLAVVSNFKIVTVYPKTDIALRLGELEKYMDYWIEQRVQNLPTFTFKQFRKQLYR